MLSDINALQTDTSVTADPRQVTMYTVCVCVCLCMCVCYCYIHIACVNQWTVSRNTVAAAAAADPIATITQ